MFDEPSAGFYQALPQAGQRPGADPRRQHQPPPQIPEVVATVLNVKRLPRAQARNNLLGPLSAHMYRPGHAIAEHGVKDYDELAHARGERNLGLLSLARRRH